MQDIRVRVLPARSSYWCVAEARHGATSFNPNTDGDPAVGDAGGRFHPFETAAGQRVPTKYLADHANGAFAETLMRDDPDPRVVPIGRVEACRLVQLSLTRPVRLADLTVSDPDSQLVRLIRGDHRAYVPLRKVAATLHASHSGLDGLLWEGRQLDQSGMLCLVLFGDRVSSDVDLAEIESLELDRGTGLDMMRAAARLRRYRLPGVLEH